MWVLCRGPFRGSAAPVNLAGLDALIAEAEERWAAPDLEPVPAWALDGIHTTGSDPRFAGNWAGLRNLVAMYERTAGCTPMTKPSSSSARPRTTSAGIRKDEFDELARAEEEGKLLPLSPRQFSAPSAAQVAARLHEIDGRT
jgi:hypothetical protein